MSTSESSYKLSSWWIRKKFKVYSDNHHDKDAYNDDCMDVNYIGDNNRYNADDERG